MTQQEEQLAAQTEALAVATRLAIKRQGSVDAAKQELKEAKDELKEAETKLHRICKNIMDIKDGQLMLPFGPDGDPDHLEGTPALNAVAAILYKARNSAKPNALAADVENLTAHGFSEKDVEQIKSDLGVAKIGELAEKMQDGSWKVAKFGPKKRDKLAEVVGKLLAIDSEKGVKPAEREAPDNRVKRCLSCSKTRPQTENPCSCGSSTFELEDPSPDDFAGEGSLINKADCVAELFTCESGKGVRMVVGKYEDHWYAASSFMHEGELVGSEVPHHKSFPFGTQAEALRAAAREASGLLLSLALDDDAQNVREYLSNMVSLGTGATRAGVQEEELEPVGSL